MLGLDNQFADESKKLFLKYHRFCFLPTSGKADLSYSWHELARRMIDCRQTISKFDDVFFDIDEIDDLDRRRCYFLGKLYSLKPEVDIKLKAYTVRSKFNRRHATEIL